ncbi:MAG: aminomethyl-transferring glycine dehydrogenase subunit GcvPA [Deltaproteobacteria bacterium]|nr:aminomethyl-transferring glycine dehydrogenase subunit GcvPA [Deltaproteobacteria bacterium]
MRYIPHTPQDIKDMLKTIGLDSVDDLFKSIPSELKLKADLKVPPPLAEVELKQLMAEMAERNINLTEGINFIGAGAYYHYVPSVIAALIQRGEFLTAYTPYQPEVSQGTLQSIFEFQTMMSELTGMEVANASHYDLSTACAEALMMAQRINSKKKALVARSLHPQYREVIKTYFQNQNLNIIEIPFAKNGAIDLDFIYDNLDDDVSAVMVQSPNFFGVVEDMIAVGKKVKEKPALFINVTAESLAYSVLTSPGEAGADIAVGEGMSLGLGPNYGGPYLGIFATQQKYIRSMPGRLVGQTTDKNGERGYVLTFATREQHIRREKATSNICTNQSLCALMCSIYLSLMGPEGLKKLALLNMHRLRRLEELIKIKNSAALTFNAPKFNETVIELTVPAKEAVIHLLKDRIFSGVDLATYYPELDKHLLVCTTEMVSGLDVEVFVEKLARYL